MLAAACFLVALGVLLGSIPSSIGAPPNAHVDEHTHHSLMESTAVPFMALNDCTEADVQTSPHSLGELDLLGSFLSVMGLTCIVYGVNQSANVGWSRPDVIVSVLLGVLLLVLFFYVERRAPMPIMPPSLWVHPSFARVLICMSLGWGSFGVFSFYTIQFMEVLRGDSALLASVQLIPLWLFGLVATMFVWRAHGKLPSYALMALSMLAFGLGNLFVSLSEPSDYYFRSFLFFALCLAPFGMDLSYPAASLIVSDTLPMHLQGIGASLVNMVVNVSISLGLSFAATLEAHTNQHGDAPLQGMRNALYLGTSFGGLGLLIALSLKG